MLTDGGRKWGKKYVVAVARIFLPMATAYIYSVNMTIKLSFFCLFFFADLA